MSELKEIRERIKKRELEIKELFKKIDNSMLNAEMYINDAEKILDPAYEITEDDLKIFGSNKEFKIDRALIKNRSEIDPVKFDLLLDYLDKTLRYIVPVYSKEENHTIITNLICSRGIKDIDWTANILQQALTGIEKSFYNTYYVNYEKILKGEGTIPETLEELAEALIMRA